MSEENNRGESGYVPLETAIAIELEAKIALWHTEVASLLPISDKIPQIDLYGHGPLLIKDYGVGGSPTSENGMTLMFDPDFPDKKAQLISFKGTYYHENYHRAQGWLDDNGDWKQLSALGNGILEGAATVFERTYTDSKPVWGQYDPDVVMQWLTEVKALDENYDRTAWKFFHPEKRERNILYRTGAYVVDTALIFNPDLKIENLSTKSWQEILDLSNL